MEDIAIVSGASSGLGFEIAKRLVEEGTNVCILSRDGNNLNNAYEKLLNVSNAKIEKFIGNVSDEEFVTEIFGELTKKYKIKWLYNVAGIGMFFPPEETTKEMIENVFEANLYGLILMSTAALKQMKINNEGNIINIMSSSAKQGRPNESIYCAAKWGARGYTESLIEWSKGTNIRVFAVYPGGMNTPFWDKIDGANQNVINFMDPKEVAEQIIYSVTNKRTIKITDITIDRI